MYRPSSLVAATALLLLAILPAEAHETTTEDGLSSQARAVEVAYEPASTPPAPAGGIRLASGLVDTTPVSSRPLGSPGNGPVVVQFVGPIAEAELDTIKAAGGEILSVLPDDAIRVRIPDSSMLTSMSRVLWVGRLTPDQLVHPAIDGAADQMLRVVIDPGAKTDELVPHAAGAGATVLRTGPHSLIVRASREQAVAIASASSVVWVEPWQFHVTHNEAGAALVGADLAVTNGYDGSGQIVAVADTGLGGGTAASAHRDIPPSRIVGIQNRTADDLFGCYTVHPDGAGDPDSGHGTHVAGTVLSSGDSEGVGRGVAPGASLYFQAVEEYLDTSLICGADGYYLIGIPLDLAELLQDAYDAGARVHQNSWGADVSGDYTADAAAVDGFVWENRDLTMVVSAGNAGIDADADGVVDEDSISSPATAKNVLAVGASESVRSDSFPCDSGLAYAPCSDGGGVNDILSYGDAWPTSFPASPIADDVSADDGQHMAAFSSRGPTNDGRIKPDVVAPGTWILSSYSDLYQEGYDNVTNPQTGLYQSDGSGTPYDGHYKYFSGTSMAAPMVSGAAVIVRDYYATAHGLDWISAALVKATIINSADDLTDENNDGVDNNAHPIPNNHEGWGRINVDAATDGSATWFDNGYVETGMQRVYRTAIADGTPLKVTMAWSDYPGVEGCGACLVNDVDLRLIGPDGSTFHGNHFVGGWTPAGIAAPDDRNNVESVYVESPAAGAWTIEVLGRNIPMGPQDIAIVIDADFDSTIDVTSPTWTDGTIELTETGETLLGLAWSGASDNVAVTGYDVFVDGIHTITTSSMSTTLTDLAPATSYEIDVQAHDAEGNASTFGPSITAVTATDFVDTNGHTFEDDIAWLSVRAITQGCDAGRFCPDDPMTRAQMGSLLARALNLEAPPTNRFDDVTGTHAGNINAIAHAGITVGCDPAGSLFCPDELVSRAQMATFIDRAFDLIPSSTDHFDDDNGSTHEDAINRVAETGITLGCGTPRTYCPDSHVTRGQIAAFLHRTFDNLDLD